MLIVSVLTGSYFLIFLFKIKAHLSLVLIMSVCELDVMFHFLGAQTISMNSRALNIFVPNSTVLRNKAQVWKQGRHPWDLVTVWLKVPAFFFPPLKGQSIVQRLILISEFYRQTHGIQLKWFKTMSVYKWLNWWQEWKTASAFSQVMAFVLLYNSSQRCFFPRPHWCPGHLLSYTDNPHLQFSRISKWTF